MNPAGKAPLIDNEGLQPYHLLLCLSSPDLGPNLGARYKMQGHCLIVTWQHDIALGVRAQRNF